MYRITVLSIMLHLSISTMSASTGTAFLRRTKTRRVAARLRRQAQQAGKRHTGNALEPHRLELAPDHFVQKTVSCRRGEEE
jgi:hypothetical protein